ncbi:aromatic hydrocarbon degradation protein [Leptotrichia sp. OH3620_COT-345]|uniref:OmpP1/FadL family transporter n=1 Tax=Leptotrichia sp. OH3620_COT-345 TaxID=2491048 RepID=UPI000F64A9A1|nr:outer membrane protein transport protein [Leptotrichia sp. OH3620_COT-345]RRD40034.1 aromatic hydrocarbon degradation protein [Leptotrichia sp. OH3620_COT-345]
MKLKIAIMSLLASTILSAASIDYLSNNSASFFQNPSQTGKITVEGVFYNPAGTVFLEDGIYLNANMQNSLIEESMILKGKKYGSKTYAGAPSFNVLYKKDNFSIFGNASVIAGGATLKYKEGVAGVQLAGDAFNQLTGGRLGAKLIENNFKGQNRYYQLMTGGAYRINDKFSIAGGLKYVLGVRKLKGNASYSYNPLVGRVIGLSGNELHLDSERTASGIGGVIGFDYKPTDTLNFGLKYETPVKLKFKAKASEVKGMSVAGKPLGISFFYPEYADGAKYRRDLPGVLSLGVSKDMGKFTYSAGYIHYFNKAAKMDRFKYKNGHELNLGLDYRINDKFIWHAGFNYADTGAPRNTFNDVEYGVNSQIYATGLTYKPTENSEWKFGIAHVSYNSANGEKEKTLLPGVSLDKSQVKYDKSINVFTVGYTHKF